ncbi:hypothetical protein AGMMS50256_27410 [Betaproteobacteria bacterium]|nr:hypothetical protein AGMMS50256_27410 [Betaproteobacteria bacterium]
MRYGIFPLSIDTKTLDTIHPLLFRHSREGGNPETQLPTQRVAISSLPLGGEGGWNDIHSPALLTPSFERKIGAAT